MTKHWMSRTRFYRIYCHIWNRCNRKDNENYSRYWGKWIENKWNKFEEFMSDMYSEYVLLSQEIGESNVSIERMDNSWNYCKENCKRIHINKQQSNRDTNHYLEYNGKKQTIRERAREIGIKESVLRNRVLYYWFSTEDALTRKVWNNFWNPSAMRVSYGWKEYTVKELENILPYSRKTIYRRIKAWELV